VLKISGRLDSKMYGGSVPIHLTAFHNGRGKPRSGPQDGNGRRSIYLGIRRNFLDSFMMTFDFPTPFSSMGRRPVSNVPAQALALMNNPFIQDMAGRWGRDVKGRPGTTEEKIGRLFEAALTREADPAEIENIKSFMEKQASLYRTTPDNERVWTDVCHIMMNMKEFIYLN
ncbi:MAG: DUF1553 domain-containing protein, partial [Verrucomicrobiota bacterium]